MGKGNEPGYRIFSRQNQRDNELSLIDKCLQLTWLLSCQEKLGCLHRVGETT